MNTQIQQERLPCCGKYECYKRILYWVVGQEPGGCHLQGACKDYRINEDGTTTLFNLRPCGSGGPRGIDFVKHGKVVIFSPRWAFELSPMTRHDIETLYLDDIQYKVKDGGMFNRKEYWGIESRGNKWAFLKSYIGDDWTEDERYRANNERLMREREAG